MWKDPQSGSFESKKSAYLDVHDEGCYSYHDRQLDQKADSCRGVETPQITVTISNMVFWREDLSLVGTSSLSKFWRTQHPGQA